MFGWLKIRGRSKLPKRITYEESRELVRHPDASVRQELATRTDVRPEILYFLAEDDSADVRREIATNDAAPAHANVLLARDRDEVVRVDLAGKIARLAPDLSQEARDRIQSMMVEAMEILAQDELVRVRQVLAEALKDVPNAPRHVIQSLARDVEVVVAGPVLEFSPLLTDEDLLEIIESATETGALGAISRRSGVSGNISDAIARSHDTEAIRHLLGNSSAQIREETLDWIVEESRRVSDWQMPLAKRPSLPARAARKLTEFVANSVLASLRIRIDMDEKTAGLVADAVRTRMGEEALAEIDMGTHESLKAEDENATATATANPNAINNEAKKTDKKVRDPKLTAEYVQKLYVDGKLDEELLNEELATGNRMFVTYALAMLAGLPPTVVTRISDARSAKATTALAWKAGLKMRFAIKLQARFSNVPSREILQAKDGVDFPLSEEDMNWQLDFYIS